MKKITTLILVAFFGLMVSASAAVVTVTNSSNYEVTIDSRTYSGNNTYNITDLAQGNHVISVYQVTSSEWCFWYRQKNQPDQYQEFYT